MNPWSSEIGHPSRQHAAGATSHVIVGLSPRSNWPVTFGVHLSQFNSSHALLVDLRIQAVGLNIDRVPYSRRRHELGNLGVPQETYRLLRYRDAKRHILTKSFSKL